MEERRSFIFTESKFNSYIKSLHVAFKADVEELLLEYQKLQSLKYKDFAKLWQSKYFTLIFADMTDIRFLKIFCEMIFLIVKKYIIFESNIYIQTGAYYLLYGLYYKQPIEKFVKIRLTMNEYKSVKSLMDKLAELEEYEPIYTFAKMRCENAFHYCAYIRPLSLTASGKTHFDKNDTFTGTLRASSLDKFQQILIDNYANLHSTSMKYEEKLLKLSKKYPNMPNLMQVHSSIETDLLNAYENIFGHPFSVCEDSELEIKSNSNRKNEPGNNIGKVKERALTNQVAVYRGMKKVITALDLQDNN